MKTSGIIRRIDDLGRVVIPVEMRRVLENRLDAAAVEAAARSILDKRNPSEKQGEGL